MAELRTMIRVDLRRNSLSPSHPPLTKNPEDARRVAEARDAGRYLPTVSGRPGMPLRPAFTWIVEPVKSSAAIGW
jgi:hypothetical protein